MKAALLPIGHILGLLLLFIIINMMINLPATYLLGGGSAGAQHHKTIEVIPYIILSLIMILIGWRFRHNSLLLITYVKLLIFLWLFYAFLE